VKNPLVVAQRRCGSLVGKGDGARGVDN